MVEQAKKTKNSSEPQDGEQKEKMTKKEKQTQTKKQRKAEYLALKRKVLEFEQSNFTHVVLIREGGSNWWKAFDHSAIFLSVMIGNRLKRKYNLHEDSDFGVKTDGKVVLVGSIGALETDLRSLRIYPEVTRENSRRFLLDEPITHEAYKDALGEEDRKRERANKVFVPKHLVPALDEEIKGLQRHVRILTSGMKSPERDAYGTDMRKVVVKMCRLCVKLDHDRVELEDFLKQEQDLLLELDEFANVVMTDGPYDVTRMAKFAEQYLRVEAEIEREVRKRAAKAAEEEIKGKAKASGAR